MRADPDRSIHDLMSSNDFCSDLDRKNDFFVSEKNERVKGKIFTFSRLWKRFAKKCLSIKGLQIFL
jgi:hypothetical protein